MDRLGGVVVGSHGERQAERQETKSDTLPGLCEAEVRWGALEHSAGAWHDLTQDMAGSGKGRSKKTMEVTAVTQLENEGDMALVFNNKVGGNRAEVLGTWRAWSGRGSPAPLSTYLALSIFLLWMFISIRYHIL